jgi:lipopolysaccharide export system permease protein
VITVGLLVVNLLKLIDLVINHGVGLPQVLRLLCLTIPTVLEQSLPMAVLLGVLLGMGRMSSDQEVIAARACGIGLHRLALPVMILAIALYPFALLLAMKGSPLANVRLRGLIFELTRTSATSSVAEKIFNRNIHGLTLYFERAEPTGSRLTNVLVSDARDPAARSTIVAKTGILISHQNDSGLTLRLSNGWIFGSHRQDNTQHLVQFDIYDVNVALDDGSATPSKTIELSMQELHAAATAGIKRGRHNIWAESEIARRWMIAAAIIPFAAIGMLLGLTKVRGGRYERMILALACFFAYYVFYRCCEAVAETRTINAYLATSLPNIVFSAGAFFLFYLNSTDLEAPGAAMASRIRAAVDLKFHQFR